MADRVPVSDRGAGRPLRPIPLALGLAVLAGAWLGPLPAMAARSFAAHMTMHMAVVAVAAGLLALAVAGGRLDPARRWSRAFPAIPASLAELIVVWAWHAPALHAAARAGGAVRALEQATFLLAGLWVWLSALGGGAERGSGRAAAGVVGLLLTSMHMTLLGALLALTPRPLYPHAAGGGVGHGTGGLGPLADQHLGGAIMLLVGGAAYLAGGLWLTAGLVRQRRGAVSGGVA